MTTATQTIDEVRATETAKRIEWERVTIGAKLRGREFTIAELRSVFEKVENKDHWKNEIDVIVDDTDEVITLAAIEFFHGRHPRTILLYDYDRMISQVRIRSFGYAG